MALVSRRILLQALAAQALGAGVATGQARAHRKPKPLGARAVSDDWRSFLGPSHNAVSTETPLTRVLPPPLVWEMPKGTGYASPAVAGAHLVFVHRLGDEEIVECLHPETGARRWQFRFGTEFEDRYGYNNGPRSSPVVDGDRVFTVGAEGKLHCLDLATGALRLETRPASGIQGAAGFLRHGVDAARRGRAAHRQCRRAGRTLRHRARQDHGPRALARRTRVGAELRVARPCGHPRPAPSVRLRGRRIRPAGRRVDVD